VLGGGSSSGNDGRGSSPPSDSATGKVTTTLLPVSSSSCVMYRVALAPREAAAHGSESGPGVRSRAPSTDLDCQARESSALPRSRAAPSARWAASRRIARRLAAKLEHRRRGRGVGESVWDLGRTVRPGTCRGGSSRHLQGGPHQLCRGHSHRRRGASEGWKRAIQSRDDPLTRRGATPPAERRSVARLDGSGPGGEPTPGRCNATRPAITLRLELALA
jgi:hypothetical protein